ncbi:unnamed protein product [Mesocestoides corti]|uniref:Uncharacterized protein n=1 Tax=Mesocestoides corti TaxID=53468 RepID=A0A0R3U5R2_MESCO|nr:unnamed protein product [Mesocestoides corti]
MRPSQNSTLGAAAPNTMTAIIQKRIRQINFQSRMLKICGMVCLTLSVAAFTTGVTLMILDFDGNDDEYYMEDGVMKTRMGMFDYGVIILGVAVVLTVCAAIFWGLLCFLPAASMASLQAAIAASVSTVGGDRCLLNAAVDFSKVITAKTDVFWT